MIKTLYHFIFNTEMESSKVGIHTTESRDTEKPGTSSSEKKLTYREWEMDRAIKAAYEHPNICWRESSFRYDAG